MKKILIVIDNLNIGGIASALYNFINVVSKMANCDLMVFNKESIDRSRIPNNINVIDSNKRISILGYYQHEVKKKSNLLYIYRGILVVLARIVGGKFARKILLAGIPILKGYDLAISYAQDESWNSFTKGCNDYVLQKVEAQKKATFIHCDYSNFGGYNKKQYNTYEHFDYIVNLSESCKNSFIKMFPGLDNKCIVCENFVNISDINNKSKNKFRYDKIQKKIFVSVCRLSPEKGIERTIKIFKKIILEGIINFQWIIIGEGPSRKIIESLILKYNLHNKIILLGEKKNPYYYMKDADVFLLTSYNEAAPMVFGECQVLGIPVITTNTCSAIELIQNRMLGVVCENSEDGLYDLLKKFLKDELNIKKNYINSCNCVNNIAEEQIKRFLSSI